MTEATRLTDSDGHRGLKIHRCDCPAKRATGIMTPMRRLHAFSVAGVTLALLTGGSGCAQNERGLDDTPLRQGQVEGPNEPNLKAALGTPVGGGTPARCRWGFNRTTARPT